MNLYASIVSDDPRLIFDHLPVFEENGMAGIHFDAMDGNFVPRIGLYPELLASIKEISNLPIEAHLMLSRPEKFIEKFVDSGANRILVHIESLVDPISTLELIESLGVESCVVLNPGTDFINLESFLDRIEFIMLMAINPGIPRHSFIPSTLDKLKACRNWLDKSKPEVKIGIDGGVTFENAKQLYDLGADWLICGSGTIFNTIGNLPENILRLTDIFEK
jgi:ribulose-phosphate 3-epimerase